jgi:hypothetical protein
MRVTGIAMTVLLVSIGACGHKNTADQALNTDLNLAAQQAHAQDSLSAIERSDSIVAASHSAAAVPSHAEYSARHHSESSSGSYAPAAAPAPAPVHATTVKHTQRDAAIGAAAGAVIGAVSSRNKVKGGIIGAAAGGILGAVVGNNVDVKKKH